MVLINLTRLDTWPTQNNFPEVSNQSEKQLNNQTQSRRLRCNYRIKHGSRAIMQRLNLSRGGKKRPKRKDVYSKNVLSVELAPTEQIVICKYKVLKFTSA